MHHFNAIMQSRQVQTLSTSDTSGTIRDYTNVTDVLAAQEVALFLRNMGQFDVPPPLQRESVCEVGKKKGMSGKVWIRALLHAFFLIHPSMCRQVNSF